MRARGLLVPRRFHGGSWPPEAEAEVIGRLTDPGRRGDIEFLGPPVWEKFGRSIPANETSIVLRAAGVLFPGDIEERGVAEILGLPDIRARWLLMPHHGKFFRQHQEFVRRVAPEV